MTEPVYPADPHRRRGRRPARRDDRRSVPLARGRRRSPTTRAWTERAERADRGASSAASPAASAIRRRLDELLAIGALSTPTPAHGRYFYQRRDGRQNQPVLYVRDGVDGADRVAVDPNALDPAGTTALDWYYPSDDGRLLAYGLSENGSEQSVLHVLDVDARHHACPIGSPRTRAADLAWLPDGFGFYYTRYPAPGDRARGRGALPPRASTSTGSAATPPTTRWSSSPREKEYWPGREPLARRALAASSASPARSTRPISTWATGTRAGGCRPRAGAGRRGPAGVVRRRGRARTAVSPDQSRCADLPALRGRSRRARAGALARARAAAAGRGARRRAGRWPTGWRSSYLERAIVPAPPRRPRRRRCATRSRCPTLGSLFGLGRRVGWPRAVLRLLLVHRAAERLPARSQRPTGRRSGAGSRPTSIPTASRCEQVSVPSRDGTAGHDVPGAPPRDSSATGDTPTYLTGVRRLQHQHDAGVLPLAAALARARRPRRRSPTSAAAASTARRGTRAGCSDASRTASTISSPPRSGSIRGAVYPARAPGGRRRLERRTAHGRGAHPAARALPGRGGAGAAARHAALPPVPDRPAVDSGVRLAGRSGAVPLAPGVLAVPPRAAGHAYTRPCSSRPPRATRGWTRCTRAR